MKKNCRIFISYRGETSGNTEGKDFAEALFKYYRLDPFWKERYGKIYYSPLTDITGHITEDLPEIMETVEYFIMPLTESYFDDFWDEENNCPDKKSVTYQEITAAIKQHATFICVAFPNFKLDLEYMNKLFADDADAINGRKQLHYTGENQKEVFMQICEATLIEASADNGMSHILSDNIPNINLSFKSITENKQKYPFYQKLFDVKKITLLNYAASSFVSGIEIASVYEESDSLKRWFMYHLANGDIIADIILTDPLSYAAQDAADFKMYPESINSDVPKDEIILRNMNKLFLFMREYPQAKLNVYLTNIALPYGIMMTEHKEVIQNDGRRPSFYLLKSDTNTSDLYTFFSNNIDQIRAVYSYRFNGHPKLDWMNKNYKNIKHKGMITRNSVAHSLKAITDCIEAEFPIEVDLLCLPDGAIILGRADEYISVNGQRVSKASCMISDINVYNKKAKNKIPSLDKFLNTVNGSVPVLLEIKVGNGNLSEKEHEYIKKIVARVTDYIKSCSLFFSKRIQHKYNYGVAIHSSNPYALDYVKSLNCMIPCGIIVADFQQIEDTVGKEFVDLHKSQRYLDFFTPDFISCDIRYLNTSIPQKLRNNLKVPMIGWTVKNSNDRLLANDYCDNTIVEGG